MEVRGQPAANRAAPVREARALAAVRDPVDREPAVAAVAAEAQVVPDPEDQVPVGPDPVAVVAMAAAIHR